MDILIQYPEPNYRRQLRGKFVNSSQVGLNVLQLTANELDVIKRIKKFSNPLFPFRSHPLTAEKGHS